MLRAYLLCLLWLTSCVGVKVASYDGILRKGSDGRQEAYMIPPFSSSHASFVEVLSGGKMALAWFSGSGEGQSDVAIVYTTLSKGSTQWPKAVTVSQRTGYSNQNPVLFFDTYNKTLHLFHSQQPANQGEANAQVWYLWSADGEGNSWTKPELAFPKNGSFDRNRIIRALTGHWIMPMYYATTHQYSVIQVRPEKEAKWTEIEFPNSQSLVQPTVVRLPNNALKAFFRDRRAQHIYSATSADDGKTWTSAKATSLPNNNSGITAYQLVHTTNNTLLVFNNATTGRLTLTAALSEDGGETWKYSRLLEPEATAGPLGIEYSYPSALQTSDGNIHVSYTYNRQTIKYCIIDEAWIKAGKTLKV